jgi:hypothetical protein
MTTSTITSIEKYVQLNKPTTGQSSRNQRLWKKPQRTSHGNENFNRYDDLMGLDEQSESRIARQNRVALTLRDTDRTMQQIGIQISRMQDALDTIVKQNPPYPPGSQKRNRVLGKANALRKQIELLTFAPLEDDNPDIEAAPPTSPLGLKTGMLIMEAIEDGGNDFTVRRIVGEYGSTENPVPALTGDAKNSEIKASILLLKETGAFIRRQRDQLKSETRFLLPVKKCSVGLQEADFKSLFISKHLRHPGL